MLESRFHQLIHITNAHRWGGEDDASVSIWQISALGRRTPADPFHECVRKSVGALKAHHLSDDFDFVVRHGKQVLRVLDAKKGQVFHRSAPEFLAAHTAQVLTAHAGDAGNFC